MTAAPPQEVLDPAVAALHRAMPYTRLVDCGMNPADARVLLAATAAGQAWAEVAGELARDRSAAVQSALAAGHRLTAAQSARWAAGAALFAQMADHEDTPRKRRLYRLIVPEGASGCAVAFVRSDGLAPEPPADRAGTGPVWLYNEVPARQVLPWRGSKEVRTTADL